MVDHPNIVTYLDDYHFQGKQYIVMELIESGNLTKLIEEYQFEQKFIPEELIFKYFSQLISVLKYMYEERIIHQDIKTNNILYMKSNVVKLGYFGIAKVISNDKNEIQDNLGSSGGSVAYDSSEVSQGDFYFFPTDVWNLGIIMYQLMSLELPFEGSNSNRINHLIIKEDYTVSPIEGNYSEELKQIVYKMLETNQYDRIHIEELFGNTLFSQIDLNQKPFQFFLSGIELLFDSNAPKKYEPIMSLFKASADLGDPRGLWSYGMALSGGYDDIINPPEAINYYKKSVDLGESKGMSNYGFVLAEGYNGGINLREAMKLF
jgi:serine/threonine protein kinase